MKINHIDDCWNAIVETLTELLEEQGQEPGEITPATQLNADLGLSSVEAIHMMIMLEDKLDTALNFEKLAVRDGEYVQDISVAVLLDFIARSVGLKN